MKNLSLIICLLISVTFSSCSTNKSKKIDMGVYLIDIPQNWKKINIQGIDSDMNAILTSSSDTILSDYGVYSEKFEETNKVFSKEQILKYKAIKMDVKELHSSDTPEIDQTQGTFLKEYYYYDTINKHIAKVKIPKKESQGETGIYFNSINKNRLTIIGRNLKSNEQNELLKAFETIRFKE
ncbi:hypothetical protein [Flavobacterium sp.]|uniref:hypothetical protein n=1 Tax=Flavobacterium sp. TaxID=239 RepID=UPI003D6BB84E